MVKLLGTIPQFGITPYQEFFPHLLFGYQVAEPIGKLGSSMVSHSFPFIIWSQKEGKISTNFLLQGIGHFVKLTYITSSPFKEQVLSWNDSNSKKYVSSIIVGWNTNIGYR